MFNHAPQAPHVPRLGRDWLVLPLLLLVSFLLLAVGYLQYHWPQVWVGGAPPLSWEGAVFELTQGQGGKDAHGLTIEAVTERNIAVAAIVTKAFRARDYATVTWNIDKLPAGVELAFLWRTAEQPSRLHSRTLAMSADRRVAPLELWNDEEWHGQIVGLALAVKGRQEGPLILNGVKLKPVTLSAVVARIWRQWLATPGWDARSINFANAAALQHEVPLLLAVSATVLLAIVLYFICVIARLVRPQPMFLWTFVFVGWLALDARWQWILFQQLNATAQQFAGKSWKEKHLAADDSVLFEFALKAGAAIPGGGRVLFLSDDAYARGKGAYYLYPHNVMAGANFALAQYLKRGEHVILYAKPDVAYDPAIHAAVSEQGTSIAADLVLAANGNLLLRIR